MTRNGADQPAGSAANQPTATDTTLRSVERVVPAWPTVEGAGLAVNRAFPTATLQSVDPFLLLDEMGPMELAPGDARGAPAHPHRGFETVTYLLAGQMDHRDSRGNAGKLAPGDVQWMTAGAGVVHSQMPAAELLQSGGRLHGFQLWVNLPASVKMIRPRYQEIPAEQVPQAQTEDGRVQVRVIAGACLGAQAIVDTRTPISYLHVRIEPGAQLVQPIPTDHRGLAYIFAGAGRFGAQGSTAARGELVLFGDDGTGIRLQATPDQHEPLELLLFSGRPLQEPVARYGPFVMNTHRQIMQALRDFESGDFGNIDS